jgi:hypothetical protein
LGRNNRENRKKKSKKRQSHSKKNRLDPQRQLIDSIDELSTSSVVEALTTNSPPEMIGIGYRALRSLAEQIETPVWKFNVAVFELAFLQRFPSAFEAEELKRLCAKIDRIDGNGYRDVVDVLQFLAQGATSGWELPEHWTEESLLEFSPLLLLPFVFHAFFEGRISLVSSRMQWGISLLDELLDDLDLPSCQALLDVAQPTKRKSHPAVSKLKKLETWLRHMSANHHVAPGLIDHFVRPLASAALRQRFEGLKPLDPGQWPRISELAHGMPKPMASDRIEFQKFPIRFLSSQFTTYVRESAQRKPGLNFRRHIGLLTIQWRHNQELGGTGHGKKPDLFLQLWNALTHGVPSPDKEWSLQARLLLKAKLMESFKDSFRLPMALAIVEALYQFDPNDLQLAWLLLSYDKGNKKLREQASEFVKMAPAGILAFDPFYHLFVTHKLHTRREFREYYWDRMGKEQKREILRSWLVRMTSRRSEAEDYEHFERLTFGILLREDSFPLQDLYETGELEPDLILWSAIYLLKSGKKLTNLSRDRIWSLLVAWGQPQHESFAQRYGRDLFDALVPSLIHESYLSQGILVKLLPLVGPYASFETASVLFRRLMEFKFRQDIPGLEPMLIKLEECLLPGKPVRGSTKSGRRSTQRQFQWGDMDQEGRM